MDISRGKIINRQNLGLADELGMFAVGNRLAVENNPDVPWALAHVDPVSGIAVHRYTLLGYIAFHPRS
jgi:hypothetical protein